MVKVYEIDKIRNVALLGHSGSGKTSLAEAMLFNSGAINRLGKVEEGNTASDYDEEEIKRTISINATLLPVEWKDCKINVIDLPGYLDFVGEVISGLTVANAGVVVVDGSAGVEVGTILAWKYTEERQIPRVVFINKMEREHASYRRVIDELREKFGGTFVPMQFPIRDGEHFKGVVDLLTLKAHIGTDAKTSDVPANIADDVEAYRLEMIEAAAEGDDALMEKYFEEGTLTNEEITLGLREGIKAGKLIPVLCGSATANIAVRALMDTFVAILPTPAAREVAATANGEDVIVAPTPTGPIVLQVFKTLDDQYGTVSCYKVLSGTLKPDTRLYNTVSEAEERFGQLFLPRGKEQLPVEKIEAGDIGAAVKLNNTKTGDTLCEKSKGFKVPAPVYPNPLYAVAVHPRTQTDTGKLGPVTQRLTASDPTLSTRTERRTREFLLEGMGETHINVVVKRMSDKYGLNIDTTIPKVPYQETITKIAKSRYRHKKQSGGSGQFGEIELRIEPTERGSDFEFTSEIFGGAVSSVYLPSVEKGIRQVLPNGVLAGSPIVDVKAIATDGKEHPVDSKDIAFQIAGRECFKQAFLQASPVLLEPIMEIKVTVPETYTGDVISDLTTKRGQVQGMEQMKGDTILTAIVPLAEIQRYGTDLRSLTQGRGIYEQTLSHYQTVPTHLAQEIIETYKKEQEEAA